MAIVLYQVKTTINEERDDEFNRWYNEVHCPDVLSFRGCVSARRYRAFYGDESHQYLTVYEFQDEATFSRWVDSEHRARMVSDYEDMWGPMNAARSGYVQIWPA